MSPDQIALWILRNRNIDLVINRPQFAEVVHDDRRLANLIRETLEKLIKERS